MTILGERVIAIPNTEEDAEPEQTEAGIYIPPSSKEDKTENSFVVTGTGTEVDQVSEGDLILVGNRTAKSADKITIGGNNALIFNQDQIIAVDKND